MRSAWLGYIWILKCKFKQPQYIWNDEHRSTIFDFKKESKCDFYILHSACLGSDEVNRYSKCNKFTGSKEAAMKLQDFNH